MRGIHLRNASAGRVRTARHAGSSATLAPAPGEITRLLTGAPIPPGVEAVVMEEKVLKKEGKIAFKEPITPGLNVRRRGEPVGGAPRR